jgi:hypothetical protein
VAGVATGFNFQLPTKSRKKKMIFYRIVEKSWLAMPASKQMLKTSRRVPRVLTLAKPFFNLPSRD